jgi:N6-adenosine-specific RNA methylase IME4
MLRDALQVMEAWGFRYVSHAIWDKIHIGTGYWFRNRHELLLVGTKGDVPAPAMGDQFTSVVTIARKEHSAKPEQFLELIEQYFPHLPKIELNRRGSPRPGWDAWGNEAMPEAAE